MICPLLCAFIFASVHHFADRIFRVSDWLAADMAKDQSFFRFFEFGSAEFFGFTFWGGKHDGEDLLPKFAVIPSGLNCFLGIACWEHYDSTQYLNWVFIFLNWLVGPWLVCTNPNEKGWKCPWLSKKDFLGSKANFYQMRCFLSATNSSSWFIILVFLVFCDIVFFHCADIWFALFRFFICLRNSGSYLPYLLLKWVDMIASFRARLELVMRHPRGGRIFYSEGVATWWYEGGAVNIGPWALRKIFEIYGNTKSPCRKYGISFFMVSLRGFEEMLTKKNGKKKIKRHEPSTLHGYKPNNTARTHEFSCKPHTFRRLRDLDDLIWDRGGSAGELEGGKLSVLCSEKQYIWQQFLIYKMKREKNWNSEPPNGAKINPLHSSKEKIFDPQLERKKTVSKMGGNE